MDQPTRPSPGDEAAELKAKGIFVAVAFAVILVIKFTLGW